MKRIALLLALCGCTFSQKHPGVTVGLATGGIGFFACQISVEKVGTCSAIGAATGLVLGGITGLITLLTDSSEHELPRDEEDEAQLHRVETTTEPPPGLPDGGVPISPADAGVVLPAADAG